MKLLVLASVLLVLPVLAGCESCNLCDMGGEAEHSTAVMFHNNCPQAMTVSVDGPGWFDSKSKTIQPGQTDTITIKTDDDDLPATYTWKTGEQSGTVMADRGVASRDVWLCPAGACPPRIGFATECPAPCPAPATVTPAQPYCPPVQSTCPPACPPTTGYRSAYE